MLARRRAISYLHTEFLVKAFAWQGFCNISVFLRGGKLMYWKTHLRSSTVRAMLRPANCWVMFRALRRAVLPGGGTVIDLRRNLSAAYQWLCTAQDASSGGGVAGCYNLLKGWGAPYPETTGYIIPTFLHYAQTFNYHDARRRAIRMADWEVTVQLPSGAVRSGMLNVEVGPAVFNTGQVLFGWISAYGATGDDRYAHAASRASEWLVNSQDDDGAWRKNLSVLTTSSVQAYNVRAAWGLAVAAAELNQRRWMDAALKNADWTLDRQTLSGWFGCNAFANGEVPLLHTIGYVLEGLLGIGELTQKDRYISSVVKGVEPLLRIYDRNGLLKGRYNEQWQSTVSWRCLTGEAQVALVLFRLARITGDKAYAEAGECLIRDIARRQDVDSPHPESYGSVAGSHPLWGSYGPFNYLNWAAKFFMDALLLHLHKIDVQDRLFTAVQARA
jgi:hypothetical protein